MPQFDETSPLNEICVLAFKKKKKFNSNKQKKRSKKKKKTKNIASSLIKTKEALPVSFN